MYIQDYFYDNILIQKWPIDLKKINDKVGYWFWFKSMENFLLPLKEKKANSILKNFLRTPDIVVKYNGRGALSCQEGGLNHFLLWKLIHFSAAKQKESQCKTGPLISAALALSLNYNFSVELFS